MAWRSGRFSTCGISSTLATVVMLSLAACSSSGSGPIGLCVSDGPSISNLAMLPASAVLGEGGGSIDVAVSFDFRTRDGAQLAFVQFRLLDAGGSRIINESIDVYRQNIQGQGTYTFSFPAPTQPAQTYTFRVRLTDECAEESSWAEVPFRVIEPAGLGLRTGYGVARLNVSLYVIGGRDASGFASETLLHHDFQTGMTSIRAPMPEGRVSAAVVTYDDLIFVFGGQAFGYEQDSTFVYDPRTDLWSVRSPMPRGLSGADAFVLDGTIYVARDGSVDHYDPVIDTWDQTSTTYMPR